MDNITDEERKVVDELKRRTVNEMTPKTMEDPTLFYRFAKARDFNLVDAEAMLRKHISWRKEYQIDTILTDYKPEEVLTKYGCSSFVCFDKEGSVVRLQDWGRADFRNVYNIVTKDELAKYWFLLAEQDKVAYAKRGGNINKPVYWEIYDLDELSYANALHVKSLQYLIYGVQMLLDNYPECVKCISVINAPFYFPLTYAMLKPILPASITEKLRVYGTDGWKEVLLKGIDADELPAYLGGKKTDPDGNPLCETIIQRGNTIPKYFKHTGRKGSFLSSDAEKITVLPFSKEELTYEIKEHNSYLEWEFEVKNRDIDFSVKYKGQSAKNLESQELVPRQRIESSLEPEKRCFKCEKIGYYSIIFDNSFSWLHTKEVYYKIRIRTMDNNELCERN